MNDRKFWTIFGLIFVLATAGSAYAIYAKQENITQRRDEVARLGTDIQTARKTITTTASLEKEVIVLRELSAVFEEILPTTDGARNLIKNFYNYSRETGVQPTSFQPQASRTPARGEQSDFDRFSYTLEMTGDTFQFLDFINRIETHSRFMSIPSFKLTAGSRKEMEQTGSARHAIQMDVETYVYQPKTEAQRVPIDGYDRKRDLLVGEINRRRQALRLQTFQYRGSRGRRDPWIDPRVSVEVLNFRPFYILGQVNAPGSYPYVSGLNVRQAVAIAGGFTRRADQSEVVIVRDVDNADIKYAATPNAPVLPGDTVEVRRRLF